ncbi:MAG: hypothetical protein AVDCRST_MAG06-832, partial [uncultured Nocardioides sp.]
VAVDLHGRRDERRHRVEPVRPGAGRSAAGGRRDEVDRAQPGHDAEGGEHAHSLLHPRRPPATGHRQGSGHGRRRAAQQHGTRAPPAGADEPGLARPHLPALGGRAGPRGTPDAAGRAAGRPRRRGDVRRARALPDGRRRTRTACARAVARQLPGDQRAPLLPRRARPARRRLPEPRRRPAARGARCPRGVRGALPVGTDEPRGGRGGAHLPGDAAVAGGAREQRGVGARRCRPGGDPARPLRLRALAAAHQRPAAPGGGAQHPRDLAAARRRGRAARRRAARVRRLPRPRRACARPCRLQPGRARAARAAAPGV